MPQEVTHQWSGIAVWTARVKYCVCSVFTEIGAVEFLLSGTLDMVRQGSSPAADSEFH